MHVGNLSRPGNRLQSSESYMVLHTVAHNCHDNSKKEHTVNKENLTNKKLLLAHKKGFLLYKQYLLTYTKKRFASIYKKPRQLATANSCGKFLLQIPTENSRGKFPRKILKCVIQ